MTSPEKLIFVFREDFSPSKAVLLEVTALVTSVERDVPILSCFSKGISKLVPFKGSALVLSILR
jgi:hypothetical protein